MRYSEALDYMAHLAKFGFNLGLERVEKLLQLLGNPEKELAVVHIGGTNGKGSTTAILSNILTKSNYKVGTFTSPHLHCYRERTRVRQEKISEDHFVELIERIKPLCEQMVRDGYEHPTEFEVSTAMSLTYFKEQQVDLVLLEVGLGGAIDSTNVVTPLITVLTNVTMEHTEYLGNTIAEIAKVKAGIIKDERSVVTASDDGEALAVIEKVAAAKRAQLYKVQEVSNWNIKHHSHKGMALDMNIMTTDRYDDLFLSLSGEHQVLNLASALTVVNLLNNQWGFKITAEHVRQGASSTNWPARMETFKGKTTVLIDGAHNVAGVKSLKNALTRDFCCSNLILVIGMLADKERREAISLLAPIANAIVVTKPNNPRAGNWQELAVHAADFCNSVILEEDIGLAVDKAMGLGENKADYLVCITGSLYMVAAARERIITNYWHGEDDNS